MSKRRLPSSTTAGDISDTSKRSRRQIPKFWLEEQDEADRGETSTHLPACTSVLNKTELLLHIISFLPVNNIFNVQYVSKYWKTAISSSPSIQRKLFLRLSAKPRKPRALVEPKGNEPDPDPDVLVRRYTIATSDQTQHLTDKDTQEFLLEVDLNPLFEANAERDSDPMYEGTRMLLIGTDEEWGGESVIYKGSMATLKQRAATYLSDPPCSEASVSVIFSYNDADATAPFKAHKHGFFTKTNAATTPTTYPIKAHMALLFINSPTGLKIKDILEALECDQSYQCSIEALGRRESFWDAASMRYRGMTTRDIHRMIKSNYGVELKKIEIESIVGVQWRHWHDWMDDKE